MLVMAHVEWRFVRLNLNVAYNNLLEETCCDPRMRDNAAVTIRTVAMGTQSANSFVVFAGVLHVSEAALLDSLSVVIGQQMDIWMSGNI